MQKILTLQLLESLESLGYRYFLSRTTSILGEDADTCVTLKPVKLLPSLRNLPEKFDAFFKLSLEPRQMAMGVSETIVLVDLSDVSAYA